MTKKTLVLKCYRVWYANGCVELFEGKTVSDLRIQVMTKYPHEKITKIECFDKTKRRDNYNKKYDKPGGN